MSVHQLRPLPRAPSVLGLVLHSHPLRERSSPPARTAKQSRAAPSEQCNASTGQEKSNLEKHIKLSAPIHPLIRDTQPRLQYNPFLPTAASFGPAHIHALPRGPFHCFNEPSSHLEDGEMKTMARSPRGLPAWAALWRHHRCQDHDLSTVLLVCTARWSGQLANCCRIDPSEYLLLP